MSKLGKEGHKRHFRKVFKSLNDKTSFSNLTKMTKKTGFEPETCSGHFS